MSRADVVVALLIAAGFGAALWEASSFQYGTEFAPGPGFAPVWLSGIGLVLSLLIAFSAWHDMRTAGRAAAGKEVVDKRGLGRVAATVLGLVGMMLLVHWIGFVLAVLAFLLFLTLFVQGLRLVVGIPAALLTVAFVYLVFVRFLGVPIPAGPLGF
jgi:putative tricarboxylic transport membrane protein